MSALNLDVYHIIALAGDARMFRGMAATTSAHRKRLNADAVQAEAKRRFARKRIETFNPDGTASRYHRVFHALPDGTLHGVEEVQGEDRRCLYRCQWLDGERCGDEEWFSGSGTRIYHALWQKGERAADGFHPEHSKQSVNNYRLRHFLDGRDHNLQYVAPTGQIWRLTPFVCGCIHGPVETWHSSGKRSRLAHYEHDKLHGTVEEWSATGTRTYLAHYKRGVQDGAKMRWTDEGLCTLSCQFVQGKPHGRVQEWTNGGVCTFLAHYHHGKLHGVVQHWNKYGTLTYFAHFLDGELHGLVQHWNEARTLLHAVSYQHGQRVQDTLV